MEFVFVVPRELVLPSFYPHGLVAFGGEDGGIEHEAFARAVSEHGFFCERAYAEHAPHLKQIIPYGVVVSGGKVLLLKRLKKGGESRLHDKLSIGVGGHINPCDDEAGRSGLLDAATHRELAEELAFDRIASVRSVGILNDDSNPVGAVHLGLVQVVTIDGPVSIRETDQLEGELVTPSQLRSRLADGADFETWSSLLVPELEAFLPLPSATLL
jgi:predicted NUDIX family phosphoesterase